MSLSERLGLRLSIRQRLLVTSLVALPLFLSLTGWALEQSYRHSLESGEQEQARGQFYTLLGAIEFQYGQLELGERLKEPRYWSFRSGLYAEVRSPDNRYIWRSLSAESLSLPFEQYLPELDSGIEYFDTLDIEGESFFRFHYRLLWENDGGQEIPLHITVLSSQATFTTQIYSFRNALAFWLSAVALILLAAQAFFQRWGLRPLRQLEQAVAELEGGRSNSIDGDYPIEISGLTDNLNSLLDKEQKQRERYRNTLGDLAHSLKTPLSVLKNSLNEGVQSEAQRQMAQEQLQRMDNIIAYQLQRAVSAGPQLLGQKTPLEPLVERLRNTLLKVHRHKGLSISIDTAKNAQCRCSEDELMELLGNLMDNACKAAKAEIIVRVAKDSIDIEDDGPGIGEALAEKLLQRGQRGDQYGAGQGLGLSIVNDIVQAQDARLKISRSELGGACFSLRF